MTDEARPRTGAHVIVTLPEIWQDVQNARSDIQETRVQVNEVALKLDKFISVNQRLDSHKADIEAQDTRLRKVEAQLYAQWVVVGIVVVGLGAAFARVFTV